VNIDSPSSDAVKISKKNVCFVEIVPDNGYAEAEDEAQQKMLEYLL